jgi:hypothetical protein
MTAQGTSVIQSSRRGFLLGLGVAVAAPAIVRATSLMPVRALEREFIFRTSLPAGIWRQIPILVPTLETTTRWATLDVVATRNDSIDGLFDQCWGQA